MQTNPAAEQNKKLHGQTVHGVSLVGEEKVSSGKDLSKSQELSHWHRYIQHSEDDKCPVNVIQMTVQQLL